MYLESIFIGGDICSQLPEEAKKFDNIDKMFKKVTWFCFYLCVCGFFLNKCIQSLLIRLTFSVEEEDWVRWWFCVMFVLRLCQKQWRTQLLRSAAWYRIACWTCRTWAMVWSAARRVWTITWTPNATPSHAFSSFQTTSCSAFWGAASRPAYRSTWSR